MSAVSKTIDRMWTSRPRSVTSYIGMAILCLWISLGLLSPVLAPHGPSDIVGDSAFAGMSANTPLGTDYLGRDVYSRVLYGARLTLGLAAVTTALAFVGGVFLGGIAGLFH